MEDRGWRIAGGHKAGAAIVSGRDDGLGAVGLGGGKHGARDFVGRTEGDSADRGTRSAQEGAERAGGFGGIDHFVEKGDQLFAKGLMQMIGESALELFVFAGGKGGGDGAGIPAVFHRVEAIDPGGQETACVVGGDFEIRNQEHKV